MPLVPRPSKKCAKILYNILGKPANMRYKPTAKQREINERLKTQERMRLR